MMSSPSSRGLRSQSPPCWAWYEQIPYEDEYTSSDEDDEDEECESCSGSENSNSDGCSEDGEDYGRAREQQQPQDQTENQDMPVDGNQQGTVTAAATDSVAVPAATTAAKPVDGMDVDDDARGLGTTNPDSTSASQQDDVDNDNEKRIPADVKGKQKAVDPVSPPPPQSSSTDEDQKQKKKSRRHHHHHRRPRQQVLRPIVTIQRSQGFVWNQDLFVPPYIKDRYVASTSPPNAAGFSSSFGSRTNPATGLPDYEVEVVEIRVNEGDLESIIPP